MKSDEEEKIPSHVVRSHKDARRKGRFTRKAHDNAPFAFLSICNSHAHRHGWKAEHGRIEKEAEWRWIYWRDMKDAVAAAVGAAVAFPVQILFVLSLISFFVSFFWSFTRVRHEYVWPAECPWAWLWRAWRELHKDLCLRTILPSRPLPPLAMPEWLWTESGDRS